MMDDKERTALKALHDAQNAIQRAMEACGDAKLIFMNTVEPLLQAHNTVTQVALVVQGDA